MKTIGLLGGMSWESTLEYYRTTNQYTKQILGSSHSAKCIMYSYNYHELEELLNQGRWKEITHELVKDSKKLKEFGADFILICANTMHIVADEVQNKIGIEVLHIVEATKAQIMNLHLKKVGLLGTKFTMESSMYPDIMKKDGIEIIVPKKNEQDFIHHVIYDELILGVLSPDSKHKFVKIIDNMKQQGAQGVILGCTEIPSLIKQEDVDIPIFDTMQIHAIAAVKRALL